MPFVVALVGQTNVGKSSIFNALIQKRDAIVHDQPGVTRDRIYGKASWDDKEIQLIDTGGFDFSKETFSELILTQTKQAVAEADVVVFVVNVKWGVTTLDQAVAEYLRAQEKPVILVVNKVDGEKQRELIFEFYSLGLGEPHPVSASHRTGLGDLKDIILQYYPDEVELNEANNHPISLVLLGRPNVGKSTLINRLIGEERVIMSDIAGTTRDVVSIPFTKHHTDYLLIDTAGIRKKTKTSQALEKFSVLKSLEASERADVVVLVLDAQNPWVDQDLHLFHQLYSLGKSMVILVNKIDRLDISQRKVLKEIILSKMEGYTSAYDILFVSGLKGAGMSKLWPAVKMAYDSAHTPMTSSYLSRMLEKLIDKHPPPMVKGHRIKLRFAHPAGQAPLRIVIHGNQLDRLPQSYLRYLQHGFQEALKLKGTPILFEFKNTTNPFAT